MSRLRNWVPVEGFAGYSVSPLGQVRKDDTKRVLDIRINQLGVAYVGLMRDGIQCIRSLPLLVARAFIPQPSPLYDTPINLDGDRTNCRIDNLMWRPRWYAVRYNRQFQIRYENPIQAPVRVVDGSDVFPTSWDAAIYFGLLEREVVLSVLNRTYAWPDYLFFELVDAD